MHKSYIVSESKVREIADVIGLIEEELTEEIINEEKCPKCPGTVGEDGACTECGYDTKQKTEGY